LRVCGRVSSRSRSKAPHFGSIAVEWSDTGFAGHLRLDSGFVLGAISPRAVFKGFYGVWQIGHHHQVEISGSKSSDRRSPVRCAAATVGTAIRFCPRAGSPAHWASRAHAIQRKRSVFPVFNIEKCSGFRCLAGRRPMRAASHQANCFGIRYRNRMLEIY